MHALAIAALAAGHHHAVCLSACQMRENFRQANADLAKAGPRGWLMIGLAVAFVVVVVHDRRSGNHARRVARYDRRNNR